VRQQSFYEKNRTAIITGAAIIGVLIVGYVFFQGVTTSAYTCSSELTPGPVESVTPRPSILVTPSAAPTASAAASADASAVASPAASSGTSPAASSPASPAASAQTSPAASSAASASPAASPAASPSPSASASPEPEPTARLGFTTTILGQTHVSVGTINYGYCPPTSGNHYNIAGRGPINAQIYPASQEKEPGGWVHNLEHGWVALLYRCPSGVLGQGDCATQAEMDQMTTWFGQTPSTTTCAKQAVVARFDSMNTRFALVAWGRALLFDEFNLDTAVTFAQQWTDHEAVPERATC
jgi:hypothetical protein